MNIMPSTNAPSAVVLHAPEPITAPAPNPNVVVPIPVASAANVSLGVSVAAASLPQPRDVLSHLTPGDREAIAAATGVQLSSGDVVTEARSSGVPPWGLIMALAMDRKTGAVQGEITPQYLSAVFARHANAPMPFHPQYLNAALLYLRAQAPSGAAQASSTPTAPSGSSGTAVNVFG